MTAPSQDDPLSLEEREAIVHAVAESCPDDLPQQHARQRLIAALNFATDARLTYAMVCGIFSGKAGFTFTNEDTVAGIEVFEEVPE